jgi:arylsulfatase A-like enzyme
VKASAAGFACRRRREIVFAACAVFLLSAPSRAAPNTPAKPNVVILLADDLGFADVGYHGGEIETPNIDGLARAGVRLDRFYAAPICSPTRAALMTGRDPMKLGIAYDQIHPWYNGGLPPGVETLPKTFQKAGYQTALVGKWHLGHSQAHQLPTAHGFEHFHGHLQTNTDYYEHEREGGHDLQENGRPVDMRGRYLTHIQSEQAVRFLKGRDPDRPFLLYLAFTAPHSPMQAPEETRQLYAHLPEKNFRRTYAAMVHEMDVAIGNVLETLEAEGLDQNTLVLFFSDNGGYYPFGANNAPLRGQKGQTFEGGIRVPAALRWPREVPAGGRIEEMVTVLDVFPTLASAAGIRRAEGDEIDGVDMWPVIHDGALAAERAPVFFASEIPIPGLIHLCVLDGEWKLVQIVREGQTETHVRDLLFRLDQDPNEEKDLSLEQPEIVARLAAKIRRWRSQHPMAGFRGTLVAHPGWVAPHDWAEAVTPQRLLQPAWQNELPFPKALLEATKERGVLVDEAARRQLEAREEERSSGWEAPPP